MKISPVLRTICITLCLYGGTIQAQTTLEPLYPEKWSEVENYIRDNWMEFVESNPRLPKPYSYALNPGTLYYTISISLTMHFSNRDSSNRPVIISTALFISRIRSPLFRMLSVGERVAASCLSFR